MTETTTKTVTVLPALSSKSATSIMGTMGTTSTLGTMGTTSIPVRAIPVPNSNRLILAGPCIILRAATVAEQVQALRQSRKVCAPTASLKVEQPDLEPLRCRKKGSPGSQEDLPEAKVSMTRRNARERKRVKLVNQGFETLRQRVPGGKKNRKMSKVDTLKAALDYIQGMEDMIREHDEQMDVSSLPKEDDACTTKGILDPNQCGKNLSVAMASDSEGSEDLTISTVTPTMALNNFVSVVDSSSVAVCDKSNNKNTLNNNNNNNNTFINFNTENGNSSMVTTNKAVNGLHKENGQHKANSDSVDQKNSVVFVNSVGTVNTGDRCTAGVYPLTSGANVQTVTAPGTSVANTITVITLPLLQQCPLLLPRLQTSGDVSLICSQPNVKSVNVSTVADQSQLYQGIQSTSRSDKRTGVAGNSTGGKAGNRRVSAGATGTASSRINSSMAGTTASRTNGITETTENRTISTTTKGAAGNQIMNTNMAGVIGNGAVSSMAEMIGNNLKSSKAGTAGNKNVSSVTRTARSSSSSRAETGDNKASSSIVAGNEGNRASISNSTNIIDHRISSNSVAETEDSRTSLTTLQGLGSLSGQSLSFTLSQSSRRHLSFTQPEPQPRSPSSVPQKLLSLEQIQHLLMTNPSLQQRQQSPQHSQTSFPLVPEYSVHSPSVPASSTKSSTTSTSVKRPQQQDDDQQNPKQPIYATLTNVFLPSQSANVAQSFDQSQLSLPTQSTKVAQSFDQSTNTDSLHLADNWRHQCQGVVVPGSRRVTPVQSQAEAAPSPSLSTASSQTSDSSYDSGDPMGAALEEDLQELSDWITELCKSANEMNRHDDTDASCTDFMACNYDLL